jgi:hypothetical protein
MVTVYMGSTRLPYLLFSVEVPLWSTDVLKTKEVLHRLTRSDFSQSLSRVCGGLTQLTVSCTAEPELLLFMTLIIDMNITPEACGWKG